MKFTAILAAATLLTIGGATVAIAQEPPAATPPVTPATATSAVVHGEEVFNARCKMCHGEGGSAPGKDFLASKTPDDIFNALKSGPMAPMASGLSDDDMKAVAAYLTAKPAA